MTTLRQSIQKTRADWEIVSIGAHKFWKVPSDQLLRAPLNGETFALLGPILFDGLRDEKREFPGSPSLEGAGPFISSGVAVHTIGYAGEQEFDRRQILDEIEPWDLEVREHFVLDSGKIPHAAQGARIVWENKPAKHLTARQMIVFNELDWYGECYQVLEAHGWTKRGQIADDLVNRLDIHFAQKDEDELLKWVASKKGYDAEDTKLFFLEVAATYLATPLSRLWYAASMVPLYYLHQDTMRVGFLWSEYLTKMRFELFAFKHIEMTEKNRVSGLKGGQADKRRERYNALDRLARNRMDAMLIASDKDRLRTVKAMAREYDAKAEEPLFSSGLKPLSDSWYRDWISHFLLSLRNSK